MFQWFSNRLRNRSNSKLEQPPTRQEVGRVMSSIPGGSTRRGVTLRPIAHVKFENRRRTRVARVSRKANR